MRKEFQLDGAVRSAVLHATARGAYELRLYGRRAGDQILAPDWTEYARRIQVQTWDVTPLLRRGLNVLGVTVGKGWMHSRILHSWWQYSRFGAYPQFLMQLHVEMQDGSEVVVASDGTWRGTSEGPIRNSEICDGRSTMPPARCG
jgi:alpha-L-rhamnosidase